MKNYHFLIIIFAFFYLQFFSFSQDDELPLNYDVPFTNSTSTDVYLKVYPVSMVFNGPADIQVTDIAKYDLKAA